MRKSEFSLPRESKNVWVVAILALLMGLLSPMPAQATVGTTFTSTPAVGSSVDVDEAMDLQTTFGLPTNSTLDAQMQQEWPDGQALLGTVQAPTGWNLEYRVGTTWSSTLPTDRITVSGVRAKVTGLQTGPGTANGTQAVASATSTIMVADASSINASGRGDGWDVFLTPLYILNVYHHDSNYKLECHIRSTGNLCNPTAVYQVNGYGTAGGPSGTYYQGKVYSAVSNGQNMKMICTNVASLPFTSCGATQLDSGINYNGSWPQSIGTQTFDGTRIWTANSATGNLTCFDVTTAAACASVVLPAMTAGAASISSFTSYIDNKVFVAANKLYCIVPTTGLSCSGAWPVAISHSGSQSGVIPKRTTAGVVNGVCTIIEDKVCFDLAGASATMPAALTTMLSTTATEVHGGIGWFQTTAWTGTRQYWPSHPSGSNWTSNMAQCFDWATATACSGFSNANVIGSQIYAMTIDPGNLNCVWTNGNDGTITNFNGSTGLQGCPVTTTKAAIDYSALPKFSCNVATSAIRTFQSLEVNLPSNSSFDARDLRVSVVNNLGVAVAGFQNLAVVAGASPTLTGSIDLTGLQVADTSTEFRFIVESVNASTKPLSISDANAILGRLIYEADPVQLCVQLTAVMAKCPATITTNTVSQPDLVIVSSTSYTISGSAAVTSSTTTNYQVNSIDKERCYIWQTFLNSAGQGVNTSNLGGLVDSIVFGPDHKMYVGGVFRNAGSVDTADYLAVWSGSSWDSVGDVPVTLNGAPVLDTNGNPTYAPALNGRVNSIVWTADNKMLIGGTFTNAGSVDAADYFAIYDPNTKSWSAPATPLTGAVNTIAIANDGIVYLGGLFTGKVAGYNPSTGAWVTMATLSGNVAKLAISPTGSLYAAAAVNDGIEKYDSATNSWVSVSTDVNQSSFLTGPVTNVVFASGKLYAVGLFNGVAVLDLTSDTWSWLGGAANPQGEARALAIDSFGNVYVGGAFTSAGTSDANDVTMYDGTKWHSFRDSRTRSNAMDISGAIGSWAGVWTVTISPNGVAIWGGDMVNCATRSDLDYLCYFGDHIEVNGSSLTHSATPTPAKPLPAVVWQSTHTEQVEGGAKLTLKGRLLGKTNKVFIGGKQAEIVSVSEDEVVVVMPGNNVGRQDLVLQFSDNTFTFNGYVNYKSASLTDGSAAAPAHAKVTRTFGDFIDGSPVLTAKIRAKINAFLKQYRTFETIECVGYTEGPTVLKTDYALSKNRAKNACSFAKTGLAKNFTLLGISSGQDLKEASGVRRVVITLTK